MDLTLSMKFCSQLLLPQEIRTVAAAYDGVYLGFQGSGRVEWQMERQRDHRGGASLFRARGHSLC